jgi:hypothetical protein
MCSAIKIIYGTLPRVTLNKKATQLAVCDLLFQEPLYGTTAALESMWIPFGAHCKDPYNEVSCGLFARPKHKPQRPKYSNSSSNKVLKIILAYSQENSTEIICLFKAIYALFIFFNSDVYSYIAMCI